MLSRKEAQTLTDQIRGNIQEYGKLIRRARDEEAWRALGFASFTDWLTDAVGISRSRGYQLINIAVMEEDLRAAGVLPESFVLSDTATRLITKSGSADFIQSFAEHAGDDADENELLLLSLISALRAEEKREPVASLPVPVVSREALALQTVSLLSQHVSALPSLEQVLADESLDEKSLPVFRGKLRDALIAIREKQQRYREALENAEVEVSA